MDELDPTEMSDGEEELISVTTVKSTQRGAKTPILEVTVEPVPVKPPKRPKEQPRDVLFRVRMGRVNETLRYALRSLSNVPHGEVFIVGYKPPWVSDEVTLLPDRAKTTIKWRAGLEQFALGCDQLRGRNLILIDDDMFIVNPVDSIEVMHAGPLVQIAKRKVGAYGRTFQNTVAYLKEQGIDDPLSYERHVPLPVDATHAADILLAVMKWGKTTQPRSVYGNMAHIEGVQIRDAKRKPGEPMPADFLSVDPGTWSRGWNDVIRKLFPKRSKYEVK